MAVNVTSRSPANGSSREPGIQFMIQATVTVAAGEGIAFTRLQYRINGGAWKIQDREWSAASSAYVYRLLTLYSGDILDWFVVVSYVAAGGHAYAATLPTWTVYGAVDSTPPSFGGVVPATGDVSPGGLGVAFGAGVTDNVSVSWVKLYVDDTLEQSWTSARGIQHVKPLSLGAHTYRFEAADRSGNTASTGNIAITVVNGLPVAPSGAIAVAGETGLVSVANLGHVLVSWPAFLDGNPEDDLTYTLENRPAGGAWTQVATGITGLSCDWSPDIGLGAAELRVKANDGTGDSDYLTRTGITIVSSQSPTAPVLITPAGGESWREGETHAIQFTPATHPEGVPIAIEAEFSALGDFSDAVPIGTFANSGDVDWTLGTDLVDP